MDRVSIPLCPWSIDTAAGLTLREKLGGGGTGDPDEPELPPQDDKLNASKKLQIARVQLRKSRPKSRPFILVLDGFTFADDIEFVSTVPLRTTR
jgi:hypothetical protein